MKPTGDRQERTQRAVVSIIVVNYNGFNDLDECLGSLCSDSSSRSGEIIVVDNHSTDASPEIIHRYAARYSFIRALFLPQNLGYAGAVNAGLRLSTGEYLAVLNMDLTVAPGWLGPLVEFMQTHPNAGAVNPLILLYATDDKINAIGQDIHITALGFNRGLNWPVRRAGKDPVPLSGIHGSAFLIRRHLLEEMGGWDESGFLYHEDVELSWPLHLLGYQMYCLPQSRVRHKYHLSMNPRKLVLLERNRLLMLLSHLRVSTLLFLAPFLLITEFMILTFSVWRGLGYFKAKCRAYAEPFGRISSLKARRRRIAALRRKSDRWVMGKLCWNYRWDQMMTLGKERLTHRLLRKDTIPVR
jgi:GT2 family glycosyltransferase